MVLGIISDRRRIASVKTAEKRARFFSPKTTAAEAPATVAPTVWASVFMVRIAVMGLLISLRMVINRSAERCPFLLSISTWLAEMEYSTASMSEQINEMTRARKTAVTKVEITKMPLNRMDPEILGQRNIK
jgi:hypothetical protein